MAAPEAPKTLLAAADNRGNRADYITTDITCDGSHTADNIAALLIVTGKQRILS